MRLSTLLLLAVAPTVSAFAPTTPRVTNVASKTTLDMGPPKPDIVLQETYGEGSRKYRRTVYTHNEWVKHRSSDRFIRNLSSVFDSGVYKSLAKEVLATTGVASFLLLWNALTGGYTDLAGVQHEAIIDFLPTLTLPLTPFTLLSPSLGLLLGKLVHLLCHIICFMLLYIIHVYIHILIYIHIQSIYYKQHEIILTNHYIF